ncbi:inositol monophosphatase family protein [Ekhidna sp.]|uniref:inositol monophosphatase family protein n=1 Tax=Ekhidna sp. TaxID=2608089 RepID=UPI003B51109E
MKYKGEFELAKKTAYDVGRYLMSQNEKVIDSEEGRDIKLELDRKAEKLIINSLNNDFEWAILSEESGLSSELTNNPYWVVDPIDGSLNYSRGCPIACVSIALWNGNEPILGVVYDFNRDELFTGLVGVGAWMNGDPIQPSGVVKKEDAILATGFPTYLEINDSNFEEFFEEVKKYKKIRMFGSAALSLCYVANGRVDAYREKDIKLWDIGAGVAINKALNIKVKIIFTVDFKTHTFVGI